VLASWATSFAARSIQPCILASAGHAGLVDYFWVLILDHRKIIFAIKSAIFEGRSTPHTLPNQKPARLPTYQIMKQSYGQPWRPNPTTPRRVQTAAGNKAETRIKKSKLEISRPSSPQIGTHPDKSLSLQPVKAGIRQSCYFGAKSCCHGTPSWVWPG
jgi:hypothetical protein